MSSAVEISIWMLLLSILVYVVAAFYDLREFILHLCVWLFPCIATRIVIDNAVDLSSIVH